MEFNTDTILKISNLIGFDLQSYLIGIDLFFSNDSQKIKDYYSANVKIADVNAFDKLNFFVPENKRLIEKIKDNHEVLSNYQYWILFDFIEDISTKLDTLDNYSRWARSSVRKNSLSQFPEIDYTLKQGETLENLEIKLGSVNKDQDWYDTAIRNTLEEEDYTPSGGVKLKAIFKNANTTSFNISSVVDNIDSGEKTYGKDFDRKIDFVNNDIKVLTYKETIYQSAEILSSLGRGDNPEFPEYGLDKQGVLGANKSSLLFPAIFRQMAETFKTNDSFSSFTIDEISTNQDALNIRATLTTRFGDVVKQNIEI